jgi:phospholipid/cholesterol/gamma-HCH transport system substrate-binding protein
VKTAIRKHLLDFLAILGLLVIALAVATVILGKQRFTLPAWVPLIGQDFFMLEAELSTAQAVTPGQGQTVNVAGVEVGEIASVKLRDGKAIIGMKIEPRHARIYKDASILLRPKTGLKDMVAELTPGTRAAGRLEENAVIPVSQTLPDVNPDEILAALDADTRDFLVLLLNDGAEGLGSEAKGRRLGDAIRRLEPTARYAREINEQLAVRRRNLARVVHNFSLLTDELGRRDTQLAGFVQNSNAVFETLAAQDESLKAILQKLPGTLRTTQETLGKVDTFAQELGPTLESLRPAARALGPSLRRTRPFLRESTPIIRDEIRPFTRAALPTVKELRPAMRDLAASTPDLTASFSVLNRLLNTLAYNPPGREEGFLFWQSWVNHAGNAVFSTSDAHGPIRRGLVVLSCSSAQLLDAVAAANPQLGTIIQLLNAPSTQQICPQSTAPPASGGTGG